MITQKITPSIWVETTDAKAVVEYYLSIFTDSKLKEHHQYTNPPEVGGGAFETAIIEIGTSQNLRQFDPLNNFLLGYQYETSTIYQSTKRKSCSLRFSSPRITA
jgi:predicted 3-demethylubiquinone-9 3-methyltransferase (glyoxalase superfamily)